MTWFKNLLGFKEESPDQVRSNITLSLPYLISKINHRRVRCGTLTMPSLAELREQAPAPTGERASLSEVVGDVAALHRDPKNADTLFQAASQFNLLEMASPDVTPEAGVSIYAHDRTQGPAADPALVRRHDRRRALSVRADPRRELLPAGCEPVGGDGGVGGAVSALLYRRIGQRICRDILHHDKPEYGAHEGQIVETLSRQLSWSHFRTLTTLDDPLRRDFTSEM